MFALIGESDQMLAKRMLQGALEPRDFANKDLKKTRKVLEKAKFLKGEEVTNEGREFLEYLGSSNSKNLNTLILLYQSRNLTQKTLF